MYEEFFGFSEKPFQLLPDPQFLYLSKEHKRALTYLEYGIRSKTGFILVTGEVGCGKTTLIQNLIKKYSKEVSLAKVFNTGIDSSQLLKQINYDFGLEVNKKTNFELHKDLNDFLVDQFAKGKPSILIIDEAQNLSIKALEEIRMLSNLETSNSKLLQIILVGQPELRKTLSNQGLLQLRQRIGVNCHIQSLNREDMEQYILYRLEKAGNREALRCSPEALDKIHSVTHGIPRLINILFEYLLIDSFALKQQDIGHPEVEAITNEIDFEQMYWQTDYATSEDNKIVTEKNKKILLKTFGEMHEKLNNIEKITSNIVLDDLQKATKLLERIENELLPRIRIFNDTFDKLMKQKSPVRLKSLQEALARFEDGNGSAK